jgi:hypothetical protein
MSKKRFPLDLNIWEYQYVTILLKDVMNSVEEEDGSITSNPVTIAGLFINWDGETVHLNTQDDNPNVITTSILRSEISIIEAYSPEIEEPINKGSVVN